MDITLQRFGKFRQVPVTTVRPQTMQLYTRTIGFKRKNAAEAAFFVQE